MQVDKAQGDIYLAVKAGEPRQRRKSSPQWRRIDLHLHTPASNDFQEHGVTYLDILRQAEARGLDVIAFTDHNTVAGYRALQNEVQQLTFLEKLGRIQPDEQRRLDDYRRLLAKVLILPGFEFTAMFGFHIIGLFAPETPISFMEHLLLTLNVPPEKLFEGSTTAGATADVLTAYRAIDAAGGIVIAAHANSANGVAMRGLDFGGQTRIAYTQDPHLHVLEVTDLEKRSDYTTRRFFDGSKPEYPRPMRCIQGSDAHRLSRDPDNPKMLGVGDRVTEILLEDLSFAAVAQVLKGNDLSLTRPFRGKAKPVDYVQTAREAGPSIVQSFHAGMAKRGGQLNLVLLDVCAMANTNGGTVYVGVSADPREKPVGVREANKLIEGLKAEIASRFSPEPVIAADVIHSQGLDIVRIIVQPGGRVPYAIDDNQFYVRYEDETNLAVRDEIVQLVERGLKRGENSAESPPIAAPEITPPPAAGRTQAAVAPPRTGVEIVNSQRREGQIYHTLRDLRNGNLIQNVTRQSARKLWRYAIEQVENNGAPTEDKIAWHGDIALLDKRTKGEHTWYDLALRREDGIHIYYGVTDNGFNDAWLPLIDTSGRPA